MSVSLQNVSLLRLFLWHDEVVALKNDGRGKELARELGVSEGTVSNFKRRPPSPVVGAKLEALPFYRYAMAVGLLFKFGKVEEIDDLHAIRLCEQTRGLARLKVSNTIEEYAACCLDLGLPLVPAFQQIAEDIIRGWNEILDLDAIVHVEEVSTESGALPPMLHSSEADGLDRICDRLLGQRGALEVWGKPHDGGKMILECLRHHPTIIKNYRKIIHLNSDLTIPETSRPLACTDRASRHLRRAIWGSSGGRQSIRDIAEWLEISNSVLVVHAAPIALKLRDGAISLKGAQTVQNEVQFWEDLSLELSTPIVTRKKQIRIIFASWDTDRLQFNSDTIPDENRINFKPRISGGEVEAYLKRVLDYYCTWRSMPDWRAVRNDGPRWKRLLHHYHATSVIDGNSDPISAGSVRFRALCASNMQNLSSFDPTQGLLAMIGADVSSLSEIKSVVCEIRAYLSFRTHQRGNAFEMWIMRLLSTGVHWFSQNMFQKVQGLKCLRLLPKDGDIVAMGRAGFPAFVSKTRENMGAAAAVPLLVKAIVQDEWSSTDNRSRSSIHFRIGTILLNGSKNWSIDDLKKEYPFLPPHGDHSLILQVEAIRHFIRAADSAPLKHRQKIWHRAIRSLLSLEEHEGSALKQRGVLSEEDGSSFELSIANGQYRLKLELMLLFLPFVNNPMLSGLSKLQQAEFHSELGFVRERLLDLDGAEGDLQTALAHVNQSRIGFEQGVTCMRILCRLALVALDKGQAAGARDAIRECQAVLEVLAAKFITVDQRFRLRKEERRLLAREALLAFTLRDYTLAIDLYRKLFRVGPLPLTQDRGIGYVDSLLAIGDSDHIAEAWALCERVQNDAGKRGFDHLTLRYQVRRARIALLLKMPKVAEAILDGVGVALSEFGGSAITLKEFQIESARTMMISGRPRYAFAAYALPCLRQLERTSAVPLTENCRDLCIEAMQSFKQYPEEDIHQHEGSHFWNACNGPGQISQDPFNSLPLLPTSMEIGVTLSGLSS